MVDAREKRSRMLQYNIIVAVSLNYFRSNIEVDFEEAGSLDKDRILLAQCPVAGSYKRGNKSSAFGFQNMRGIS
jgi:hypothetical protein